jgi:hypothetical protein
MQSSHASKRLITYAPKPMQDKGKRVATASKSSKESSESVSSCLHLKDDCCHVISAVQPRGSSQPKAITERSKEDNNEKRPNASHSKYNF